MWIFHAKIVKIQNFHAQIGLGGHKASNKDSQAFLTVRLQGQAKPTKTFCNFTVDPRNGGRRPNKEPWARDFKGIDTLRDITEILL